MQEIPVHVVVQAVAGPDQDHLRDHAALFEIDPLEGQARRSEPLADFEGARRAEGRLQPLPVRQPLGEAGAGRDVELQSPLLAQGLDLAAPAELALGAQDAVFLGEFRRAFTADQAMGQQNRLVCRRRPVERRAVVGVGGAHQIAPRSLLLREERPDRKQEKGFEKVEFGRVCAHGVIIDELAKSGPRRIERPCIGKEQGLRPLPSLIKGGKPVKQIQGNFGSVSVWIKNMI